MRDEKLTILLAVYNGAQWLGAAIQSVVDQSYQNWELIVVDNASTDNSYGIATDFADQDNRIQAHRLEQKGKNLAYNYAFSKATGAFVTFFAADDILPHDSIEKRMAMVVGKGDAPFVTCALKTMSDDPKYDGLIIPRDPAKPNFSGGVLLFARSIAEKIFPIPTHLPNEDTWTQLHLRAFGTHLHYPAPLYLYRIHGANSFGYQTSYREKRDGFLRRMQAYELFFEKNGGAATPNAFIDDHVGLFVKGLTYLKSGKIGRILLSTQLPLKMKLLFVYYSSPALYRLRMLLFRFVSGRMVQM